MPSSITARTAQRALFTAARRRPFSVISPIRTYLRSLEPHPAGRYPVTQRSQPGDWPAEFRRVGSQAAYFFPGIFLLLGWPYLAYKGLDGQVGAI